MMCMASLGGSLGEFLRYYCMARRCWLYLCLGAYLIFIQVWLAIDVIEAIRTAQAHLTNGNTH